MNGEQETAAVVERLTHLGVKIREARRLRALTLQELAGRVGLTASHISQIERGLTSPSVSALLSIAGALDLPMEHFFAHQDEGSTVIPSVATAHAMLSNRAGNGNGGPEQSESGSDSYMRSKAAGNESSPVVLPGDRETINIIGGIQWQRLTPTNEEAIEFLELHYPPGASSGDLAFTHRGREFGRVLQGTLLVELGFSKYTLQPGDAISFDCSIPHRLANVGDEPFVGIWVILDRM